MKKIPIFKPLLPTHDQLAPYLAKIDHTRWYSNYGPLVQQLEQRFIQHYSSHASPDVSKSLPHVVSVSNATVGLTLTLQALDLPKNSYCIVPSWTFVASALAIQNAGLTPLFVDIDPQTWCPNPDLVRELVQHHGAQISSLMVVVPFGAPIHTQMWEKLAQSLNIQLIFDAAAAFDTWKLTDSPAVLSLHATKILPAGEGGMVVSTNEDLIDRIKQYTTFGFKNGDRTSHVMGSNAKMSEYHAAVALASLDAYQTKRLQFQNVAFRYAKHFQAMQNVDMMHGFASEWIATTCNLILKTPYKPLMHVLVEQGIQTRQWWGEGCHTAPAFAHCSSSDLTWTQHLAHHTIGIPFSIDLTDDEIDYICHTIQNYLSTHD